MTDRDTNAPTAREQYEEFRKEILLRQRSNVESYDKYVITLSSSGLALSLAVAKFFESATCTGLVIAAWVLFIAAIVISIVSFLMSNHALERQLNLAEDYYLNENDEAFDGLNHFKTLNTVATYLSGTLFVVALVLLATYAGINLS